MRKRRADEEEKSGNGERWLLTYSDLITLLLALFIIMYGMSTENASKVQAVSTALSEAFNSTGAGTGDSTGTGKGGGGGTSLENADPLGTIYKQLNGYIEQNDLEDNVDLVKSDHAISIRLKDKLCFWVILPY